MKFARTHRLLVAWMLFGFILFNGLACSLCHGQMLGAFSRVVERAGCVMQHSSMPAMDGMQDMQGTHKLDMAPTAMKSMENACSFAATVVQTLIFFLALGWLIRRQRDVRIVPPDPLSPPPRYLIPRLQPQAP